MTTTNEEIRDRYRAGTLLNDGAPRNAVTADPANGAATAVGESTDVHVVNPDGTNSVDLDNAAEAGRVVVIVHNDGDSTPTLSFTDADFVGTGPSNMTTPGTTATLLNTNGETSGWVQVATGSA